MILQTLEWHLNCSWMSQFLTFHDLNALSLTNRKVALSANGARMLKIEKWELNSNEGEREWIAHYKTNYPQIINPASLYLKCLRYRHICSNHFCNIVKQDPRLTSRQKNILLALPLDTQPCKLFYWFVVVLVLLFVIC